MPITSEVFHLKLENSHPSERSLHSPSSLHPHWNLPPQAHRHPRPPAPDWSTGPPPDQRFHLPVLTAESVQRGRETRRRFGSWRAPCWRPGWPDIPSGAYGAPRGHTETQSADPGRLSSRHRAGRASHPTARSVARSPQSHLGLWPRFGPGPS